MPRAWLQVIAPPSYTVVPHARCGCVCGYHRQATGRAAVLSLVDAWTEHRTACNPEQHATSERSAA